MFVQNFLCFSLCLLSFALPLGTTEKKELEKKAFLFFMLSFQVCIDIDKIPPLSLLQAEQSQISHLFLIEEMLQYAIIFVAVNRTLSSMSTSPVLGNTEQDSTPLVTSPVLNKWERFPLTFDLLTVPIAALQTMMSLSCLLCKATLLTHVQIGLKSLMTLYSISYFESQGLDDFFALIQTGKFAYGQNYRFFFPPSRKLLVVVQTLFPHISLNNFRLNMRNKFFQWLDTFTGSPGKWLWHQVSWKKHLDNILRYMV